MKGKWILDFPVSDIIFDEDNPNETTDKDEAASMAFLRKWGVMRAVALNMKNVCVDGEHITRRAIEAGIKTVTVFQGDFKTDAEIAEVRLFLNGGPRGKPNEQKYVDSLDKIYKAGNISGFAETMGRSVDEYARALQSMRPHDPSDVPLEAPAVVKPGEIWKCGNHLVMCGDATDVKDLNKLQNVTSKLPRLLLTDPPYDFEVFDWLNPFFNLKTIEILVLNSDKPTVKMANLYAKYFIGFYIITFNSPSRFSNQPMISHRLISHYRIGKSNFQNLHDAFGTVHEIVLSKSGLTRHEKPLDLPRKLVVHYTKPGEIVLDIFAGSGSTMIACEQLGRLCYCMEKDPHKVDIILKRYEDFVHDLPVKV
jgi:hypothetical protein